EIPARTTTAEEELAHLHDTIDKLVVRLDSVTQPTSPSPDTCEVGTPSFTQLGDRLLGIGNRTRYANERLQDVLRRLEV
ncbi:MAG: hypothetical protein ACREUF_19260, partial [Solimonas sp.]